MLTQCSLQLASPYYATQRFRLSLRNTGTLHFFVCCSSLWFPSLAGYSSSFAIPSPLEWYTLKSRTPHPHTQTLGSDL